MEINTGMRGRFRLQVLDEHGNEKQDTGFFNNLILDSGINSYFSLNGAHLNYTSVGLGSTPPAATDTQLVSRIATAGNVLYFVGSEFPWIYTSRKATFGPGSATGNITEVAVGAYAAGTALYSRALVKDSAGLPTAVTVLAAETLVVYWELYINIDIADVSGSASGYNFVGRPICIDKPLFEQPYNNGKVSWAPNSSGTVLTSWFGTAAGIANVSGLLPATSALPTHVGASSIAYAPYVANSFRREMQASWTVDNGNLEVNYAWFNFGLGIFQFSIDPPIPKPAGTSLQITFASSFSRLSEPATPASVDPSTKSPRFIYDVNDLSSLFQDSAGTIPVTTVGDPVGFITDKSGNGRHLIQTVSTRRPLLGRDANLKYYVEPDGVDDFYVSTGTAPFTGGVTAITVITAFKKQGAVPEVLWELSTDAGSTTGGAQCIFPYGQVTGYARGQTPNSGNTLYSSAPFNPVFSGVLSVIFNFPKNFSVIKANGVNIAGSNAAYASVGQQFAETPLYVLSKGNNVLFSKSRLYYMIGFGEQLTFDETKSIEKWIGDRVGMPIGV